MSHLEPVVPAMFFDDGHHCPLEEHEGGRPEEVEDHPGLGKDRECIIARRTRWDTWLFCGTNRCFNH